MIFWGIRNRVFYQMEPYGYSYLCDLVQNLVLVHGKTRFLTLIFLISHKALNRIFITIQPMGSGDVQG
jgi:hypothetical protein